MSDIETGLKSRIVVNIANWLLRTFTPNYAKLLKATIICGLEWGARDCPACRLRRTPDAVIAGASRSDDSRRGTVNQAFDYAASCGKCGQDFAFGTAKERNDWLRQHDPDHYDFCSFFRQARV